MSEKAEELDLFHHQMLNPVSHTVTALTAVKNSAPQTQVSAAAIPAEPSLPVSTPSKAKKSKALKYKCETCCQVTPTSAFSRRINNMSAILGSLK